MHSAETQEAAFFLNHLSVMMAYRVYEKLRGHGALKDFAAVKIPETYLWDVRATNPGDGFNDLWDEPYFIENCRVIFGKPSPTDPSARNEYNKVLCQPLKLLAYAHVLTVDSTNKTLSFSVANVEIILINLIYAMCQWDCIVSTSVL